MILGLVAEILERVGRLPEVDAAIHHLRQGSGERRLAGLAHTAKALVAALAAHTLNRPVYLLVESNDRGEELLEPLRYFYHALSGKPARRVAWLPAYDVLPFEGQAPHTEILTARGIALAGLTSGEVDLVLVPIASALVRLLGREYYSNLALTLGRDDEVPLEELIAHLNAIGYERNDAVEMTGQFAVRGGIVDLFSPESKRPVRLELLGDAVESIREFDPETQLSVRPVEQTTAWPLTDFRRDGRRHEPAGAVREPYAWGAPSARFLSAGSSLFDMAADPVLIIEEPNAVRAAEDNFRKRVGEESDAGPSNGTAAVQSFILSPEEWKREAGRRPALGIERLAIETASGNLLVSRTQPTPHYQGNIPAIMAEARGRIAAGEHVLVTAGNTGELERLTDLCREYELPYRVGELEENATIQRLAQEESGVSTFSVVLLKAPLDEGVIFQDARLAIYGAGDVFGVPIVRPAARPTGAAFRSDFSDMKPGDFVVHVDHGIGRFDGLRQVTVEGSSAEFMLLAYAEDARLYVPVSRLDLVQKYRSPGAGAAPQLDRLGATTWEARKTRVRKSVTDMAEKLLALYADRRAAKGHTYPPDSPWQKEFEDAFEHEETPDQERAIADVKKDLESALPMDRLLCGDVGYGKTEVSMRAAFKVVSDGRQVAVLAPTTVLAFQHFQTFRRRFSAFPITVDMVSRFVPAKQQKEILARVEAGKVDILVGTHRLLSRDVVFRDLGLLIVDEEQRFGVSHKERIKQMQHNVDALAMSATPIPRTLHMSLAGMRDMSLIETPPRGRLAIQTVVAPFSESLVQRSIEQEMARGGQVFFVHNRVETIGAFALLIQRLVPSARIVTGHGQLRETDLEKVMMRFVKGDADVLLSTSIIENGLDIPRANTILINRADRFGMAELYQLRGRVGRSSQRAYAYLLVPAGETLSSEAKQRLAALREFSDLGAGFRIAALDLEMRGAGNILGREQHGHIESVGFEMYCRMLERAVAERMGEASRPELHVALNLGLDIRIPPSYMDSENLRLRIYKRIAAVSNEAERDALRQEIDDRFGAPPPGVLNLLEYAVLKAAAERIQVASIERKSDEIALRFHEATRVRPDHLVRTIRKQRGLRLDPSGVLWFNWKQRGGQIIPALAQLLSSLEA
jgi:transcription-repair coupling factor (superfamily II helicase)